MTTTTHETFTAVVHPEDLLDPPAGVVGSTEAAIRIFDADGDEVDDLSYSPADDEDLAMQRVTNALDDSPYRVVGAWQHTQENVSRVIVERR